MIDDTEITCPRCGCPVTIVHETDSEFDHGDAVCPSCGLARCPGLDCWCLEAEDYDR